MDAVVATNMTELCCNMRNISAVRYIVSVIQASGAGMYLLSGLVRSMVRHCSQNTNWNIVRPLVTLVTDLLLPVCIYYTLGAGLLCLTYISNYHPALSLPVSTVSL